MRTIWVNRGLIFENEELLGCYHSDKIAQANGMVYAEEFIRKYVGQTLTLDEEGKIVCQNQT